MKWISLIFVLHISKSGVRWAAIVQLGYINVLKDVPPSPSPFSYPSSENTAAVMDSHNFSQYSTGTGMRAEIHFASKEPGMARRAKKTIYSS
uniref:Secreted protein n=1 Tax=Ascaris lumbricoides TaxID=6252 RepID=A0A0M3HNY0_ASCLU